MASSGNPSPREPNFAPPTITTTTTTNTSTNSPITLAPLLSPTDGSHTSWSHPFKRPRAPSPTSPTAKSSSGRDAHPPSKIARLGANLHPLLPQLTGAAALEEDRRRRLDQATGHRTPGTSPHMPRQALSDLMSGGTLPMSRPQEAPTSQNSTMSTAMAARAALSPMTIPQPNVSDARIEASPRSAVSVHSLVGVDRSQVVHSPSPMEVDAHDTTAARFSAHLQPPTISEEKSSVSLSYPGIMPAVPQLHPTPTRGMSLPGSSPNGRSPSTGKKHKCHHCDTEFTRQHNLKSHLLTHSQEKPFPCPGCSLRFRRQHDLKRHSKLHTGEKPHICPKCERKFARGDALARHAKGAGGCVGRRTSVGSYVGDDDYEGGSNADADESSVFNGSRADVAMTDEERRRPSLPAFKRQELLEAAQGNPEVYAPRSTYPPIGPRPTPSSSLQGPSIASNGPSNTSLLAGGSIGITESPKPLSPGSQVNKQMGHEPSLTTQYQHSHYGRRTAELPLPVAQVSGSNQIPSGPAAHAHSRTSSGPSHQASGDSSANLFASSEQGMWAYIRDLEDKVKQLTERVVSMEKTETTRESQVTLLNNAVATLQKELALRTEPNGTR